MVRSRRRRRPYLIPRRPRRLGAGVVAKKRVHEIAKAQGVTSKELLAALKAAGIEAKAAASSVEESDALQALSGPKGDGGGPPRRRPKPKAESGRKSAAETAKAESR